MFAFHRNYPLVSAEKITSNALDNADHEVSQGMFEQIQREGLVRYERSALLTLSALHKQYQSLFDAPDREKGDPES
jgi:hypothetical protein